MSDYGIQPTGFVRKPLSVILAEIEAAMITEFGPDVIQTSQSPFGQLNGLMADLISEVWEEAEDLYQSYDPDQAEGIRLNILGRLRLLTQGNKTEDEFRKAITNENVGRIDVQDILNAIKNLDNVTFAKVYVNDTYETNQFGIDKGSISIAVLGGDDQEISNVIRKYAVPGINTYGNYRIVSEFEGYCRTYLIVRPSIISPNIKFYIRTKNDNLGCPPPSSISIKENIVSLWEESKRNGLNLDFFQLRSLIERTFSNVELVKFSEVQNGNEVGLNQEIQIGFFEIAELSIENLDVEVI